MLCEQGNNKKALDDLDLDHFINPIGGNLSEQCRRQTNKNKHVLT